MRSKYLTDADVELETRRRITSNMGPSLKFPKEHNPICDARPCAGYKLVFWLAVNSSEHRWTP